MFTTPQALQDALNPSLSDTKYLNSNQAVTVVQAVIDQADSLVSGYLPEKYRRMERTATGLVLTRQATQGQSVFTIPTVFQPATDVLAWVNYEGKWTDRRVPDSVSLSHTDNTITLDEGLDEGDMLVVDVRYTITNPPRILASFALDAAIHYMIMRKPMLVLDSMARQTYAENYVVLERSLDRLARGRIRIDEWDEPDFLDENETIGINEPFTTADW